MVEGTRVPAESRRGVAGYGRAVEGGSDDRATDRVGEGGGIEKAYARVVRRVSPFWRDYEYLLLHLALTT